MVLIIYLIDSAGFIDLFSMAQFVLPDSVLFSCLLDGVSVF